MKFKKTKKPQQNKFFKILETSKKSPILKAKKKDKNYMLWKFISRDFCKYVLWISQ